MERFGEPPGLTHVTDAEAGAVTVPPTPVSLVELAHHGDAEAFADLLQPLQRTAHRIAFAMLGNVHEAEDALQDATERAWRRIRQLRDAEAVGPWYRTIVVNECRRRLGSPWRRVLPWGLHRQLPTQDIDASDDAAVVHRALSRLNIEQRTVLVLRYFFDLPVDAIADQCGLPSGTVKSRLNRATARFRQLLDSEDAR